MENSTTKPASQFEMSEPRAKKPLKKRLKSLNKTQKIASVALSVLVIAALAFGLVKIFASPSTDDRLRDLATTYYKDKIEPASRRSTSYTLVLKNLQTIGYDISTFEKAGCSLDSYAIIRLDNSYTDSIYTIETKLIDCE